MTNYYENRNKIERHKVLQQAAWCVYDLETRELPSGYSLVGTPIIDNQTGFQACVLKKGNDIIIAYKRFGRKKPIMMPGLNSNVCPGSYPVSGYTRDDGTKVKGYIRQCGAKHAGSWRGKRFDEMTDEEISQMLDDLI